MISDVAAILGRPSHGSNRECKAFSYYFLQQKLIKSYKLCGDTKCRPSCVKAAPFRAIGGYIKIDKVFQNLPHSEYFVNAKFNRSKATLIKSI